MGLLLILFYIAESKVLFLVDHFFLLALLICSSMAFKILIAYVYERRAVHSARSAGADGTNDKFD